MKAPWLPNDDMDEPGSRPAAPPRPEPRGLLYPLQNHVRNVLDLSGLWQFQLDPQEEGETKGWYRALPNPRYIPVPSSWNDLFDDARDYLGLAWYLTGVWIPSGWRGQRIWLRVGAANYAARVWVNGSLAAEHVGGHVPFVADITDRVAWDQENVVAVSVENKQLPGRIPPGPSSAGGIFAGRFFPETTYDYFPYAGLHRPVQLYSTPAVHIDDITVHTSIDGGDGIVTVTVQTVGEYSGSGTARLNDSEVGLDFQGGTAVASVRVPSARFWSPQDPYLYPLTVTLDEGKRATDVYTLDVGIRTIEVRGDQLLLNGQPISMRGWGRHEDFPLNGRGLHLPAVVRDYELLKWVGGNAYRTAHYPHSEEEMLLADRLGVLVIDEIPDAELNFATSDEQIAQWRTQCEQDLRDMITRDKNHPSVIMWSVANEPNVGAAQESGVSVPRSAVEAGQRFLSHLYEQAHWLDGTRLVTFAGMQQSPPEWLGIGDVTCINRYYGWYTYHGRLDEAAQALARELDALHQSLGKPIVCTEFGADAIAGAHSTPPEIWTEEYQVDLLRTYLDVVAARPFVVGTLMWTFADFKAGQNLGRAAGLNQKGVFTRERRPKMAAHFLRSQWAGK